MQIVDTMPSVQMRRKLPHGIHCICNWHCPLAPGQKVQSQIQPHSRTIPIVFVSESETNNMDGRLGQGDIPEKHFPMKIRKKDDTFKIFFIYKVKGARVIVLPQKSITFGNILLLTNFVDSNGLDAFCRTNMNMNMIFSN